MRFKVIFPTKNALRT